MYQLLGSKQCLNLNYSIFSKANHDERFAINTSHGVTFEHDSLRECFSNKSKFIIIIIILIIVIIITIIITIIVIAIIIIAVIFILMLLLLLLLLLALEL